MSTFDEPHSALLEISSLRITLLTMVRLLLASLMFVVANGESFLSAGGIPNVIKMLEDIEEIQIMAIGVIRVLAMFETRSNAGFLEEIRAHKGLSPLVPFLKSTSNDLVLNTHSFAHSVRSARQLVLSNTCAMDQETTKPSSLTRMWWASWRTRLLSH